MASRWQVGVAGLLFHEELQSESPIRPLGWRDVAVRAPMIAMGLLCLLPFRRLARHRPVLLTLAGITVVIEGWLAFRLFRRSPSLELLAPCLLMLPPVVTLVLIHRKGTRLLAAYSSE